MSSKTGSRLAELREPLPAPIRGGDMRGEGGGMAGVSLIPSPIRRLWRSRPGSDGMLKVSLPMGLSGELLEDRASDS